MAGIAFAVSATMTFSSWHLMEHNVTDSARLSFEFRADTLTIAIQQRMLAYEHVLRGARGLFAASATVDRNDWKAYVGSLEMEENYPGIQGIGFAKVIPKSEHDKLIRNIRSEGFPEFKIWPEGEREIYTSIIFLEPFIKRNLRAFGFDMFTESTRHAAMVRARDTGKASLSGKVKLVQEDGRDVQAGCLLYLPVYKHAVNPRTIEEYQTSLEGYVYSPFRMKDLMQGILRHESINIEFDIYDGKELTESALLYDSHPDRHSKPGTTAFTKLISIQINGTPWTLRFQSLPIFDESIDYQKPTIVLTAGLAISILAFFIVWMLATTRNLNLELKERVTERTEQLAMLQKSKEAMEALNKRLQENQSQLVQSEKMASLGQLAAGVAHEINNPVGFIMSNLRTLADYVSVFKTFVTKQSALESAVVSRDADKQAAVLAEIQTLSEKEDLPYIMNDVDHLLSESLEGTERVKGIVQGLKSFARLDESEIKEGNINEGIEATLKMVWNELKYKCQVHKKLGDIPPLRCHPGQLNQVFMNLFVNAAHAIPERGDITIETLTEGEHIVVRISDTGSGISPENLSKIFTPFFTTKPIGVGTGLGLSVSYGIIQKHRGTIEVQSAVGKGTTFTIKLPCTGI